jgi:hypothetical protein
MKKLNAVLTLVLVNINDKAKQSMSYYFHFIIPHYYFFHGGAELQWVFNHEAQVLQKLKNHWLVKF